MHHSGPAYDLQKQKIFWKSKKGKKWVMRHNWFSPDRWLQCTILAHTGQPQVIETPVYCIFWVQESLNNFSSQVTLEMHFQWLNQNSGESAMQIYWTLSSFNSEGLQEFYQKKLFVGLIVQVPHAWILSPFTKIEPINFYRYDFMFQSPHHFSEGALKASTLLLHAESKTY